MPPVDATTALSLSASGVPLVSAKSGTLSPAQVDNIRGGYLSRKLGLGETPGERSFNLLDWGGIGYGVNSAISIAIADAARNGRTHVPVTWVRDHVTEPSFRYLTNSRATEAEKTLFDRLAEHAKGHLEHLGTHPAAEIKGMNARRLFKLIGTPSAEFFATLPESLAHITPETFKEVALKAEKSLSAGQNAKLFNGFFLLGTGGWLLMAPVKLLEDRKARIVKHFDDRYARKHPLSEAALEEIEQRHHEIEEEPKQSWASVFGSRLITYPIIMATYMGLGRGEEGNWISRFGIGERMKGFKGTDHYVEGAVKLGSEALHARAGERLTSLESRLGRKPQKLQGEYAGLKTKLEEAEKAMAASAGPVDPSVLGEYARAKEKYQSRRGFAGLDGRQRLDAIVADAGTEMGYSGIMAAMTFLASRVLGPVFGHAKPKADAPSPIMPVTPIPAPLRNEPQVAARPPVAAAASTGLSGYLPTTTISASDYRGRPQAFAAREGDDNPENWPKPYSASFSKPLGSHQERVDQRGFDDGLARA